MVNPTLDEHSELIQEDSIYHYSGSDGTQCFCQCDKIKSLKSELESKLTQYDRLQNNYGVVLDQKTNGDTLESIDDFVKKHAKLESKYNNLVNTIKGKISDLQKERDRNLKTKYLLNEIEHDIELFKNLLERTKA